MAQGREALAAMGAAGAAVVWSGLGRPPTTRSMSAEVVRLVKETNAPKSADELVKTYEGREDELLRHLRSMKVELDQQAQIKALVETVQPGKSYRELAATYTGKEDKLICDMTAQADKEAQ